MKNIKKTTLLFSLLFLIVGCKSSNEINMENYNIAYLYDSYSDFNSQLFLEGSGQKNRIVKINKSKYLGNDISIVYNKKTNSIYSFFDSSYKNGCDSDIIETNLENFDNKIIDWNDWGKKCTISSYTSNGDYLYASDTINGEGNLLRVNLETGKKKQKKIKKGTPVYSQMIAKDDNLFVIYYDSELDIENQNTSEPSYKLYTTDFNKKNKTIKLDYKRESVSNIGINNNIVYITTKSKSKNNVFKLYSYDISSEKLTYIKRNSSDYFIVEKDKIYSISDSEIEIYNILNKGKKSIKLEMSKVKSKLLANQAIIKGENIHIYYYEADPDEDYYLPRKYEDGKNTDCEIGYIKVYNLITGKLEKTENPYDDKFKSGGRCFASFVNIDNS